MELGQRLRQARLEAGLSQKALCGDTITRNMLSQIESGKAKPSMDTLRYLAARLDKPMGCFLEEQAVLSPNQTVMADARTAFAAGEYSKTLDCLQGYRERDKLFDAEKGLLMSLCLMGAAREALEEGRPLYARELLERAGQQESMYLLPALERERQLLLFETGQDVYLPADDRELLTRAKIALDEKDYKRCIQILEAAELREALWHLLRGRAALGMEDYAGAAGFLEVAEEEFPQQTLHLLEWCYRELEDYKRAYEYACKQR